MNNNVRHLANDLEAYAIEQHRKGPSSASKNQGITVQTQQLAFTCKEPDFNVNLREADRGHEFVVYEDSFSNNTDREVKHTFPIEVKKSYKATFEWQRSLVLPENETVRLPPQLQFDSSTPITLGTNAGETYHYETKTMENVEVTIPPYKTVNIEVRMEKVQYESTFTVKIVPSHANKRDKSVVLAYIPNLAGDGSIPVRGDIEEVFKYFSREFPGYTSKGTFKAEGKCSLTKVAKHRHTVTTQ